MDRPPEISQADWDAHVKEASARAEANAAPLPGPLADVLAGRPPRLGKLQLRDIELDDFVILRQLGNPVEEFIADLLARNVREPQLTERQLREALYLWTHTLDEVEALLAQGVDAYRTESNKLRVGRGVRLQDVGEAIGANVVRSFSTAVGFAPVPEGAGSVFPAGQPAAPKTGSAGGGLSVAPSSSTPISAIALPAAPSFGGPGASAPSSPRN
jgi:hypothetical protein